MSGLFGSHARPGDVRSSFDAEGATVVYDPEFPGWHLTQ